MSEDTFTPSRPIGPTDKPDAPFLEEGHLDEDSTAGDTCPFGGSEYGIGARICNNHVPYQCTKNGWVKVGTNC
jgi:hypothetical protein